MQKRQRFSCQRNLWIHTPRGGGEGRGTPWHPWWGCVQGKGQGQLVGVRWFQTKKCHFSTLVFRPSHLELMSSLVRLEHQQKDFLKSILNLHHLVLLFLSYSFGGQMTNTFIHSLSFLVNHTRFQTKRAKFIPVFRPNQCKNDILRGGTYLYGFYPIRYP